MKDFILAALTWVVVILFLAVLIIKRNWFHTEEQMRFWDDWIRKILWVKQKAN